MKRYDGQPLPIQYQMSYWNHLEALANYPVLPRQKGGKK